jgi:hypothetical protein
LNIIAAVAIFDRVIEIETSALGADHPQTAVTVRMRASVLTLMAMQCAQVLLHEKRML